jgi:hypothetical protein
VAAMHTAMQMAIIIVPVLVCDTNKSIKKHAAFGSVLFAFSLT